MEESKSLQLPPFVYIDIVKPGNHFYTVHHDSELYIHRCLVSARDEPVPAIEKKKFKVFEREFNFDNSVFSNWKDDPEMPEKAFQYDKKLWRLHRFIKEEKELVQLEAAI